MIAFLYSLLMAIFQKKFIYTSEFQEQVKLASKLSKELREAKKKGDKILAKKLEKRYEMIFKSVSKAYLRIIILLMISLFSFILLFRAIDPIYSSLRIVLPFPLPLIGDETNYFTWFIISSFLFSRLISKALKIY